MQVKQFAKLSQSSINWTALKHIYLQGAKKAYSPTHYTSTQFEKNGKNNNDVMNEEQSIISYESVEQNIKLIVEHVSKIYLAYLEQFQKQYLEETAKLQAKMQQLKRTALILKNNRSRIVVDQFRLSIDSENDRQQEGVNMKNSLDKCFKESKMFVHEITKQVQSYKKNKSHIHIEQSQSGRSNAEQEDSVELTLTQDQNHMHLIQTAGYNQVIINTSRQTRQTRNSVEQLRVSNKLISSSNQRLTLANTPTSNQLTHRSTQQSEGAAYAKSEGYNSNNIDNRYSNFFRSKEPRYEQSISSSKEQGSNIEIKKYKYDYYNLGDISQLRDGIQSTYNIKLYNYPSVMPQVPHKGQKNSINPFQISNRNSKQISEFNQFSLENRAYVSSEQNSRSSSPKSKTLSINEHLLNQNKQLRVQVERYRNELLRSKEELGDINRKLKEGLKLNKL